MGTALDTLRHPLEQDPATSIVSYWRALPVQPNTLFQMNAVLSSSPVNLGRLITVVGDDPAMAANLLREARALDNEVVCEQLLDAIVGLGIGRLQAIVLRSPVLTSSELNSQAYRSWRLHSVLASQFAEAIARGCGTPTGAQARIGGLLHDIGKLPLLLRKHAELTEVEAVLSDGPDEGRIGHCEVGASLGSAWQLSEKLCQVMREHHGDLESVQVGLVGVVITADRLCHACGVSLDAEMVRLYGKQCPDQIVSDALPQLNAEQSKAIVQQVRRIYATWGHANPGIGCERF